MAEEEAGPAEYLVKDVMTTPVVKVLPMISVKDGATIMVEKGIGSLVVVNETDSLIGIVTKTDIVREVAAKGLDPTQVTIGDIMTRNPYYVFADDSLERAVDLMSSRNIGHLPVLDPETMKPIGMISKRDIVRLSPEYIRYVLILKLERDRGVRG